MNNASSIDWIRPEEARKILKCCNATLTAWTENGTLESIRTSGGHRRYNLKSILYHSSTSSSSTSTTSEPSGTATWAPASNSPSRNRRMASPGAPTPTMRPSRSTTTRSQMARTWSAECDTKMIVRPCCWNWPQFGHVAAS